MGFCKAQRAEEEAHEILLRFMRAKAEKRGIMGNLLRYYEQVMDVQKKFRRQVDVSKARLGLLEKQWEKETLQMMVRL